MDTKQPTTELVESVDESTVSQDEQTIWQALKQNPWIVVLTFYANLGAMMIGYDNLSLGFCLAMPSFQIVFGDHVGKALVIPAVWQSLWNALFNLASLLGSATAGYIQDIVGRRAVFAGVIVLAFAGTALNYTADTRAHFLGGKLVTGFSMGMAVTAAQTYISEVAPLKLRSLCLSAYTIFMVCKLSLIENLAN